MADQIGPRGVAGSPNRRSESRPVVGSAEPGRPGQPHGAAHDDAKPPVIDASATPTGDRQARRYAHTMRRSGEVATPPSRTSDAIPLATTDRDISAKHARPAISPSALAGLESTNPMSAATDSTALYRKRPTRPALPVLSSDLIARSRPPSPPPIAEPPSDLSLDDEQTSVSSAADAPSRLPSVMLDPVASRLARPLAPRGGAARLVLLVVLAALIGIAIWLFQSIF